MGITVRQALMWGIEKLKDKGVQEPRLDSEVLLAHVLGVDRTRLYVNIAAEISDRQTDQYCLLIKRRGRKEPVSYLTGTREFMSLEFKVGPAVLIPRPETEILVEKVVSLQPRSVVDVGTGSGAVALSIAKYLPGCRVTAVDVSAEALQMAKDNAVKLGVADRVEFVQGYLLSPLIDQEIHSIDIIAANLPYIPADLMRELPDDVRLYEPALALDGGEQGLALYKQLVEQAPQVLKRGGTMLMEIGYDQGALLQEYLQKLGIWEVKIFKDFAHKDRVVSAYFG